MKVNWLLLLAAAPHVVVLGGPPIHLMEVDSLVINFNGLDDSYTARLADYNSTRGAVVVRWQDSAGCNVEQKCCTAKSLRGLHNEAAAARRVEEICSGDGKKPKPYRDLLANYPAHRAAAAAARASSHEATFWTSKSMKMSCAGTVARALTDALTARRLRLESVMPPTRPTLRALLHLPGALQVASPIERGERGLNLEFFQVFLIIAVPAIAAAAVGGRRGRRRRPRRRGRGLIADAV